MEGLFYKQQHDFITCFVHCFATIISNHNRSVLSSKPTTFLMACFPNLVSK